MLAAIVALQTVPSDRRGEVEVEVEVETSGGDGAREEEQVQAGHVNPRATLKHTLINWHPLIGTQRAYHTNTFTTSTLRYGKIA